MEDVHDVSREGPPQVTPVHEGGHQIQEGDEEGVTSLLGLDLFSEEGEEGEEARGGGGKGRVLGGEGRQGGEGEGGAGLVTGLGGKAMRVEGQRWPKKRNLMAKKRSGG